MREIRLSGSEGGAVLARSYLYQHTPGSESGLRHPEPPTGRLLQALESPAA